MTDRAAIDEKLHAAIQYATEAHYGQVRKSSGDIKLPYIVHPLAVMQKAHEAGINRPKDGNFLCALVLHDVLEDTNKSAQDLLSRFGEQVCDLVVQLTFSDIVSEPMALRAAKQRYLNKFADSDIEALTAKILDRLANVSDFFDDGSRDYADTYFHYADLLYEAFERREAEVADRFSPEAYETIWNEIEFWRL